MITSYWNDLQYLQSVCKRVPHFIDTIHCNNGFPLLRRELPNGTYHLASPPGFLSPSTAIDFIQLVFDVIQNYKILEITSAFLQCRQCDIKTLEKSISSLKYKYLIEKKPLVMIDIKEDKELYQNCKRDTRSRLKSILKHNLIYKIGYDPMFFENYNFISKKNNFSNTYSYSKVELYKISESDGIYPISIYDHDGKYLGGSIIGRVNEFLCDYILSAYNTNISNAGRAVLWYTLVASRELGFSQINLGGGVSQGDSLETYKLSFGGRLDEFKTLKLVLDEQRFRSVYNLKNQQINLEGMFPPL